VVRGGADEKAAAPKGSASGFSMRDSSSLGTGSGGSGRQPATKSPDLAPAPVTAAEAPSDDFDKAFGGVAGPRKEEAMKKADGKDGIAISRALNKMKEQTEGERVSDPVRTASGRTFLYKNGGWIDSDAVNGTAKTLKVKYLSDAYFAVLKARPELRAALALSDRLVIVVGKDKSIIVDPAEGETKVDAVTAFLK
jgi:Ca-activated chloride channel family protein